MNIQHQLKKRLINVGVSSQDAGQWAKRVQKILDTQDLDGTIDYFKRVGDCIIWAMTGSGDKPQWVKTRRKYPLVFLGIEDYPEETKVRVAKIARTFRHDRPTPKQVDKVLSAVISPPTSTEAGLQEAQRFIMLGTSYLKDYSFKGDLTDFPLVTRQFRRVQSVSGKTGLVSEPPILDSLRILADMPGIRVPGWEKVLYPLHPTWIADNIHRFQSSWPRTSVGEIHSAQEGGGKLRMFASPYTVIQSLLTPIHYFMDFFRSQLPTDCTYDQSSGAMQALVALQEGRMVHSVDLSTATCRFPWSLQYDLASWLGLPVEHLLALSLVTKGKWVVGKELRTFFNRKAIKWAVGQPLGIKPSMSLFSLTHNLLLAGICFSLELEPIKTFRVLGDDVVIFDDRVHQVYLRVMSGIGVPISWHKSHSSSTYAEFAGFSITRTGMYRAGQWRSASRSNALDLAMTYGKPLYGEVPCSWVQIQKVWLFRHGKYDPSREEYPVLLKANSILESEILKWMSSKAEFWYYTIMNKMESIVTGFLKGGGPLPFEYETPSVSALHLTWDKNQDLVDTVNTRITACNFSLLSHPTMCANEARAVLEAYLSLGVITSEEYTSLVRQIYRKANTLLYQPPSDLFVGGSPAFQSIERCLELAKS